MSPSNSPPINAKGAGILIQRPPTDCRLAPVDLRLSTIACRLATVDLIRRRRHRADALVVELLQALSFVGLDRVNVALRVERHVVRCVELSRTAATAAEVADDLKRIAQQRPDAVVRAVRNEEMALRLVVRERGVEDDAVTERVLLYLSFLDERAVLPEDLDTVVRAVADIHEAVCRERCAVHCSEYLRQRRRGIVRARIRV